MNYFSQKEKLRSILETSVLSEKKTPGTQNPKSPHLLSKSFNLKILVEIPLVLCYKNDPTRTRLRYNGQRLQELLRGRIKAKPSQPFRFYNQETLPGGLEEDQRYLLPDRSRNEGIHVPKLLEHGRSLIVIHKVKHSKAKHDRIRSSNNTRISLRPSVHTHTHTSVQLHRAVWNATERQRQIHRLPALPNRTFAPKDQLSCFLQQMEWTHCSAQPIPEQEFPPPSKPHYCIRFCTAGKKRLTFNYFTSSDGTFHLPRGAFHTRWCWFWGAVQGDAFAWAGKCPKCPRVAQVWLLLTWAAQWPTDWAVTSAGTSPAGTWVRLELWVDLRCCCSTPDMWEVQNKK